MKKSFTFSNVFLATSVFSNGPFLVLALFLLLPLFSIGQTKAIKLNDFYSKAKPEDYIFYTGDTLQGFDLKGYFEKAKALNCSSNELSLYMLRQERFFLFSKYRTVLKNSHYNDPLRIISRYGKGEHEEPSQADKDRGIKTMKDQWLDNTAKGAVHHAEATGCNNIDFSDVAAPFTNWHAAYGMNDLPNNNNKLDSSYFTSFSNWQFTSAQLNAQNTTPPASGTPMTLGENAGLNSCSWLTICTKGKDSCGGFPMVCPGFTASCRLGGDFINLDPGIGGGFAGCGSQGIATISSGDTTGVGTDDLTGGAGTEVPGTREWSGQGEVMEQSIPITAANALLTINYAAVLNDGGHPPGQQPFVYFAVYDQAGNSIPCLQYYQEATAGSLPPGYTKGKSLNWIQNNVGASGNGNYQTACYYKPWTTISFDMSAYVGTTVSFQAIACGCWPGGHFAYCYIDLTCGKVELPSVSLSCGGGTITAPPGAATYSWTTSGGGCITGGTANQTVSVGCTGTYSCTMNLTGLSSACNFTIDTAITVNPIPAITATATPTVICSGGNTTLNASGAGAGGTYTWSPSTGLAVTTGASVTASPTANQTYTVTGTTAAGCSGTQTVVVKVNTTPTVSVSAGSSTICSGGSTVLTASGATTYTWSPGIGATTSTVTVSPGSTQTYTVSGTKNTCTSTTQTVLVTVNTTPTISASGSTAICSGGSTVLTASGASSYTWSPGVAATTSTVSVSPGGTTTYIVTGTTSSCTSATQTVLVTVNTTPTISVSAGPSTICAGGSTVLTATGANSYTWSPGIAATTSTVSVSPGATTTYTVTGTSAAGCPAVGSKTVMVTVSSPPTVTVTAGSGSICSGTSTTLTAGNATTYTWTPSGTLSASTGATVTASPTTTTTYVVTGTASGCANSTPENVVVNVNTTPTLTAVAGLSPICSGQSTTLTAGGAGPGGTYVWVPSTTLIPIAGSPVTVSPTVTTTYVLTGSSSAGCAAATPQSVTVTVNTTPTLTISSAATICSGGSTILSAGGVAAGGSYTWTPNTALSASTGATVTASPTTTQTYTVNGTSAAGCAAASPETEIVTVTSTPILSAIASASPICSGNSTVLTGSNATTYVWTSSTSVSSTTGAIVTVSPTVTTTYTLNGTASGCAPSTPENVIVTVNTSPNVKATAGVLTLCSGGSTTLTGSGATTYTWQPGGVTGSTISVSPTTDTTFKVIGSNGLCKDSATISLTVNPTPTVNVQLTGISAAICPGDSMGMLANSNATSYSWSPPTGLSCTTCNDPNAGPKTTTTYTVTASFASGCFDTASQVIIVFPVPSVTINQPPTSLCMGDSISLTASGVSSYSWSPPAGLNTTFGPTVEATPTATTEYVVNGKGTGGCSAKDSVLITVNKLPVVVPGASSTSICSGSSGTTLSATGASTYTWQPGPLSGSPVAANPASSTTYTVTGTNTVTGCSDTASIIITVNTAPNVSIQLSSLTDTVCSGQPVVLTENGGSSITTYVWSNGATTSSITVMPTSDTVFQLNASNGPCGSGSISQPVYVYPPLLANIPEITSCANKNVVLTMNASGGEQAYTYTWSNGVTGKDTIDVKPDSTATYSCMVTDACGGSKIATDTITILPTPVIGFIPNPDTIQGGQFVGFVNQTTNATNYYWTFGNGQSSTEYSPVEQYMEQGEYVVTLIASNGGCADTLPEKVYVQQIIFIPNVFTPNVPGINSVFHVTMDGMKEYNIQIFNRWGQKVFESNSASTDWDGTSMSGVRESDGDYFYLITATDYTNKQYNYQGPIQLIR